MGKKWAAVFSLERYMLYDTELELAKATRMRYICWKIPESEFRERKWPRRPKKKMKNGASLSHKSPGKIFRF